MRRRLLPLLQQCRSRAVSPFARRLPAARTPTGLSGATVKQRQVFYEQALRSRRRDRVEWKGTDIEAVFTNDDEQNLLRLQLLASRVRDAVRSR